MKVTIICLIFKSAPLADWVYQSAKKYTPKMQSGEVDFLFVANDASEQVINHLERLGYPYIINNNEILTEEQLFALGHGKPEYIRRVYQGYNQGILHSKGDIVVLINSDHFFSPDWLENLLKYLDFKTVVSSLLVEPSHSKYGLFPGALRGDFGNTIATFEEESFINYANKVRMTGVNIGGAYMPSALYKDLAYYCGLYPEGNIAGADFEQVIRYGDELFFDQLEKLGVQHITAKDSIVYHLKEGELDFDHESSDIENNSSVEIKGMICEKYNRPPKVNINKLNINIEPVLNHASIVEKLLAKEKALIEAQKKIESQMIYRTKIRLIETFPTLYKYYRWLFKR